MKNFSLKTIYWTAAVTGVVMIWNATTPCTVAAEMNTARLSQDRADKISKAGVMYRPLGLKGTALPSDTEIQVLGAVVEKLKAEGMGKNLEALESFIANYPASPWVPALRANLGKYYQEHVRYGKACEHWSAAWAATRNEKEGEGKEIADFVLANYGQLLVGVGKLNEMGQLLKESEGRMLDRGSLQQIALDNRRGYNQMLNGTDLSFRCGTYAIGQVTRAMNMPKQDSMILRRASAPVTGFSMTRLMALSRQVGLEMVAVEWDENRTIPVPSVVHWKDNHYAAITAERNGAYEIYDTALGDRSRWIKREHLMAETTGLFLVPKTKVNKAHRLLSQEESDQVYGRGFFSRSNVTQGPPPRCPSPGFGGSGAGGSGGPGGGCAGGCYSGGSAGANGASGMAVWEVVEPDICLWLLDEPLGYQPGVGERISFELDYKQLENRTISPNFFGLGNMWNFSWLSYIQAGDPEDPNNQDVLLGAGGGERYYTDNENLKEYYTSSSQQRFTNQNNQYMGSIITYPDGHKDHYEYVPATRLDNRIVAFLSAKVTPQGYTTRFDYEETGGIVYLRRVIDPDGRTNTLYYENGSHPNLITRVQDPFGNSVVLQYDSDVTNPMLTNITDVVGIKSYMRYDTNGWVTNLITPYGTTKFEHYDGIHDTNNPSYNPYGYFRAARVIDPMSGTNIYMLRVDCSYIRSNGTNDEPYIDEFTYDDVCPYDLPYAADINAWMEFRNSYHWGPKQAAALSTSNIDLFTVADHRKARLRHWLHDRDNYDVIGRTLEMEMDPSPDGQILGQTTWYDYADKPLIAQEGSSFQPVLKARLLPDGTTWFQYYQRNEWGQPTNVMETYSAGYGAEMLARSNIYNYAENGVDLIEEVGPQGNTVRGYAYNENHQILRMTNAMGEVTSYTYDAQGRQTSLKTAAGLTTTNIFYSSGFDSNRVYQTIALEIGRTNTYSYTNGQVYTHTDERGLATTKTWDALGRLRRITYPDNTYITNIYNKLDLVRVTDRMGYNTYFGYDAIRRKTAETNALGNYTLYTYCSCGGLDSIRDMGGNFTWFYTDNAGQPTNVVYPDGLSVTNRYNLLGQLTNVTDSSGNSITNWFNNQGRQYASSNAFGVVQYMLFDIEDHATNILNGNGVSVATTFDNLGRLLTRTYPDGGGEMYGYSVRGLVAHTNKINQTTNQVTRNGYDVARRKTAETNANNEVVQFTYSPAGDLLTLTDGKNQQTQWKFDLYGRMTNKTDAASIVVFAYTYNANGWLTSRWTPAKGTTLYSFDAVGNMTGINYPSSPDISLDYDALNRLTNMVDAVGNTRFSYNSSGQLLSEDGPWASDTVTYTYNNRLRSGLAVQNPNGPAWNQSYAWDTVKHLTNITSPAGAFGYLYQTPRSMLPARLMLPNGTYITNVYDDMARITGTYLKGSNGTINAHEYGYNLGSQRTNTVRYDGSWVTYGYDSIGQLKTAQGVESNGTARIHEKFGYVYDGAGNLNYRTNNALLQTFDVNNLNQLLTIKRTNTLTVAGGTIGVPTNVTVNGLTAALYQDYTFAKDGFSLVDGSNTFTAIAKDNLGRSATNVINAYLPETASYQYDMNGNLIFDGVKGFEYDDENQLIRMTVTNQWKSEFVYDGKMRRRIAREYIWQSEIWNLKSEIHYVYDGNLVIQERDANNLPQVTYTRGRDLSGTFEGAGGIGGLLARTTASSLLSPTSLSAYYHADGNGNITCLTGSRQIVVARYLYDPFGNTLAMSGMLAEANTYRFSSKELHAQSGLVYYLYRYYAPALHKWVNRDPREEKGVLIVIETKIQPPAANPYLFSRNMPISGIDAWGLFYESPLFVPPTPDPLALLGKCAAIAHKRYKQMKAERRPRPNNDKWYHCVTSCEITRVCGADVATDLGILKELFSKDSDFEDSIGDENANAAGRDCGDCNNKKSCEDCCTEKGYQH